MTRISWLREIGIPDRCTRDRNKHPAADPTMRVFRAGIATILTLTVLGATCPGVPARPVRRLTHSSGVVDYWPCFSPDAPRYSAHCQIYLTHSRKDVKGRQRTSKEEAETRAALARNSLPS